ncbi:uncharacterized protein LOC105021033 isoform X4 [Esox lucius]|uniref:uncharacterized protein LOC105021033 isoform X4 n=1 Tax=Esox lucius TaxID=8010 RepID=UPI000661A97A|nr:uncharacterized protein LOC105021033 isoform X4 [Esox lucius]
MANELAFRSRVTSIMEALTTTVVQEICQLMGESYAALRAEVLHQKKRDTVMEKMANVFDNVSKPAPPIISGNFPVVGQVFNEQEASCIWLEDGAVEGLVSPVPETGRQEVSKPLRQTEDTVPWPVWLIKQEEEDDDDLDLQGDRKWKPESAEPNVTGESDGEDRGQVFGGSSGLEDFKREFQESPLLESVEDTASPIKRHVRQMLKHAGSTYFSCNLCDEKFQGQSGLARHRRHKHDLVKAYCCSVCGKGFTYIKSLNSHELSHSEVISSAVPVDETRARKINLTDEPTDGNAARDMISAILHSKPGGEKVFQEYANSKGLTDSTRRLMVNIIVADMMENHGRTPPSSVRTNYALGIVTLFPYLSDPNSEHGYEQYYDSASGSGYLTWRIKTVGRNTSCKTKKKTKSTYQNGPKVLRSSVLPVGQLSGDECVEAISQLKHTNDKALVKEKMKMTFQYRQAMIHDPEKPSTVLNVFPRFLDTPGLINQDFTMLFGEVVSGTFLEKWPTFFKPRVIADCKTLPSSELVEHLLSSAQQEPNDYGWESDLASILLLLHLLPPTSKGPKTAKIRTSQAADHLVRFLKAGTNMATFLKDVGCDQQPFLLCVGERKNILQKFYVVVDQKAIPCQAETSLAAFDELFKAHYVFSVTYHEALCNFYTFIQTTIYSIDVGKAKESSRVKEIRVRLLNKNT